MVWISACTLALSRPSLKFGPHSISRLISSRSFGLLAAGKFYAAARFRIFCSAAFRSWRFFVPNFCSSPPLLSLCSLRQISSFFNLCFNPATKQSPHALSSSSTYSLQNSREFPESLPLRTPPHPPACHLRSIQSSCPIPTNTPH